MSTKTEERLKVLLEEYLEIKQVKQQKQLIGQFRYKFK